MKNCYFAASFIYTNMRVALLGYGKMGKIIEKHLHLRQHEVSFIIDVQNYSDIQRISRENTDVIIEFTTPVEVRKNVNQLLPLGIPIVIGTTGWYHQLNEIEDSVKKHDSCIIYGTNFSIGANILFVLNELLAKMMNRFENYDVFIEERHHQNKKDSPSGTALTLASQIIQFLDRKTEIASSLSERNPQPNEISIGSIRAGEIIGKHSVGYQSDVELIEICHEAYTREGFALGAILASEWATSLKGIHEFKHLFYQKMLNEITL